MKIMVPAKRVLDFALSVADYGLVADDKTAAPEIPKALS